ncbi:PREDICTED: non-specific lipid-transfer protein-like [Ipomoea nil]|uniref:non-specific lipid-transfer protein-like n=1 Tax=Ipomoea nil TaxID=35883 RepID=UPI000900BB5A|nr:PREDICTED: non-specific lipid-transfer protein-like [Ipomoea nil]
MAAKLAVKVACMVVVCMVVAAPSAEAAIVCGALVGKLTPCLSYVQGKAKGQPPAACCGAIKSVNSAASSTADRQAACKCLKQMAGNYPGMNIGAAASIPGKCGVNIGYPISTSVDCNKVH